MSPRLASGLPLILPLQKGANPAKLPLMKKKSMPVKGKSVPNTAKSGNKYTHAGAPSAQHLSPGGKLPGTQSAKGVDVDMCGTGMKHAIKPSSPSFK